VTYQFIIEYLDPHETELPFDYEYLNEVYSDLFMGEFVHKKRIRAHTIEQAIQKFTEMYPDYDII
jgi:hypothetical protein